MRRTRSRVAAALVLAALALPATAAAQDCPQTTLGDVEDEVMCPVCGTPLELATEAPQAIQQRELIEGLIADCRSKEQIKTRLVAEFGEDVLSLPDDEGFDLAAWVVPGLAILLGLGGVTLAALRWRREPHAPHAGDPLPGKRDKSIDIDMDRYDL